MEKYEKAEQDYMAGMKYKDIAEKYKTTINTVKSWKKRYGWNRAEGAHKEEKVCTQKEKSVQLDYNIIKCTLCQGHYDFSFSDFYFIFVCCVEASK